MVKGHPLGCFHSDERRLRFGSSEDCRHRLWRRRCGAGSSYALFLEATLGCEGGNIMKRKIIVAALALQATLTSSGVAQAGYIDAVMYTTMAEFAGTHHRCPRFQVIEVAISAELAEVGVTLDMLHH